LTDRISLLRQVDLFDQLSDDCVARLAASAREERLPAGEWLSREGQTADRFMVLTDGLVEWVKNVGGEEVVLGSRAPVTYAGASNILTGEPAQASGRAIVDSDILVIPGDEFRRLLRDEPTVLAGALRLIAPVAQRNEAALQKREKLAALGTLAAGLAHELNNPAAAAVRSAADLAETLAVLQDTVHAFVSSGVERSEAEALVGLQREALARAEDREDDDHDALAASEREDALAEAIVARGLDGWRLAPALAEAGLDEPWLERVAAHAGPALGAALEWVAASLAAGGLAHDLQESVTRISAVVGAVREYTYMDRGGVQRVDLHDGLESTLTILAHKLRTGGVAVVREYDRSLPALMAHGSELNQVWTNLIDNAVDAMGGRGGTVTIRTQRMAGDCARVTIADDGPGIPPEARDRIFEPFFTTKDVGQGTGMGLDIVQGVVGRHGGRVDVDSGPGGTSFAVVLPLASEPAPAQGT
jgi:signal transduction histidine kinase